MSDLIMLSLSVYGFAIVISMLVAVMIRGIVFAFSLTQKPPQPVPIPPTLPAKPVEEIPVAAIAAAVYAVVGPHRIVHIAHAGRGHDWTTEGRASHHLSHNIARRRR